MHHNDNRRTGANLHETTLTVANVRQKFGKLVANGKVFVATYGDNETAGEFGNQNTPPRNGLPRNFYVAVYGLKP